MARIPKHTLLNVLIGNLISFLVNLLAVSGDMTLSWPSPVIPKLLSANANVNPFGHPIDANMESWLGSLVHVGAILGTFLYGLIVQNFGRKTSLLFVAVPHIVAFSIFAFAKTIYLYYFARILGGLAVGGGYTVIPMYIAEISEDHNRGLFTSTLSVFWSVGNFIPFVVGPYTSLFWFNIILACIPLIFLILFAFISPESPYYLIMTKRHGEAEKALMKLRADRHIARNEVEHIQNEFHQHKENANLWDFFKSKTYMKGLFISLVLITSQQLTGLTAILTYTEEIFDSAETIILKSDVSAIILGLISILTSFETLFVADRWGRRILLLVSFAGTGLTLLVLGSFFYFKDSGLVDVGKISWLPLFCLLLFITCYNIAAPLPWTVASELFPTNVKTYSASFISCTSWLGAFTVSKYFIDLENKIGVGQTFWVFGGLCFASCVMIYFLVPETKKKSFLQIQDLLADEN